MAYVEYEKKGNIVVVTLNRPERLNAQGRAVIDGVKDACARYTADDDARVAIITGVGRAFSAGADINELADTLVMVLAFNAVEEVKKPVIAAVNGIAFGAGFLLMLACDIRIAARSATFGLPEIARVIPLGPERLLAQRMPAALAMELLLTAEPITAQRAYEVGLVNKVVPDEELMPTALRTAERIAGFSPWAARLVKQAKIDETALSKEQRVRELEYRRLARQSEEFKKAVTDFVEKRKDP